MAKKSRLKDAMEKYKSTGTNDFFTLKEDSESAIVRFLYGQEEDDLDWFVVHEAEIGGKKRWVECPETADCPMCQSGRRPVLKIFLQLIDSRDNKVKTWERGQQFVGKITGLQSRYGSLFNRPFEVVRNGARGDTNTTYEIFPLEPDNTTVDVLQQKQELLGPDAFVLQKTNEEMTAILNGTYQPQNVQGQRQGGFQPNTGGGFNQQPQGGFNQQPQGGFQQQPPQSGGFQQQPQGGFQQQPQGGFQQTSQPQGQPSGGFQQPQQGQPQGEQYNPNQVNQDQQIPQQRPSQQQNNPQQGQGGGQQGGNVGKNIF